MQGHTQSTNMFRNFFCKIFGLQPWSSALTNEEEEVKKSYVSYICRMFEAKWSLEDKEKERQENKSEQWRNYFQRASAELQSKHGDLTFGMEYTGECDDENYLMTLHSLFDICNWGRILIAHAFTVQLAQKSNNVYADRLHGILTNYIYHNQYDWLTSQM